MRDGSYISISTLLAHPEVLLSHPGGALLALPCSSMSEIAAHSSFRKGFHENKIVEKLLVHSQSGRMNEIVMCHVHSKMKTPSAHAMPPPRVGEPPRRFRCVVAAGPPFSPVG